MDKVIDFLRQLQQNNNRDWFEDNKTKYREAIDQFNAFAEKLIAGIGEFDETVRGLQVKECTYRIYRDVRFSKNKEPYKSHMGAYICRGGKKSNYAGYYFHIEPKNERDFVGQHLMSSGFYLPEPKTLKSLRDEIFDNGERFIAAIKKADGFRLNMDNVLKKNPVGYPKDSPYSEYLRLKDMYLEQFLSDDFILSPNLLENVIAQFRKTKEFLYFVNEASEYAYDN
ncbi:MAG: DUF2461 domain-containing protein [Cytophagaceae bacterium]|jgi:uncharacterized protein (TIGR02453 family)|nr:DUF2461 domain-containing protein [Cytophagaceae bacterium]